MRERGSHLFDEPALRFVKIEVAVAGFSLAVGAFARETADADDRGIGEQRRVLDHAVGEGSLGDAAGEFALAICLRDKVGIEIVQRLIDRHVTALRGIRHGIDEIVRESGRYLAGAAAAAYIVRAADPEERDTRPGLQREEVIVVFEQHHALGRRATGKRDVCGGRGDESAVLSHRHAGLIQDPLPSLTDLHGNFSVSYHRT